MSEEQVMGVQESPISDVSQSSSAVPLTEAATPEEKLIPQSRVNELVGQTRKHAREEGYQRARQEFETSRNANVSSAPATQAQPPSSIATQDDFNRWADAREQQKSEKEAYEETQRMAQMVASNFVQNTQAAHARYADFAQKTAHINLQSDAMLTLIPYMHDMPLAGHILYEFAANPRKLVDIYEISKISPELAKQQLTSLADSISKNEAAKENTPQLHASNHLKPSLHSTDSGELSISDYRKQKWLKG